jgi:hypothetical protein
MGPPRSSLSIDVSSSDQDHFVCLVTDLACYAAPSAVIIEASVLGAFLMQLRFAWEVTKATPRSATLC